MSPFISRCHGRTVLIVALTVLAGCGGSPPLETPAAVPEATAPATSNSVRIVFLGDSIAAGYGLAEHEAFPAVTGELLRASGRDVQVVNAGVSGDTSAGGLRRLDWILRQEPEIVVVELGGNDALRGQPLESVEANLREIVRRSRGGGARVVLLGMDIPTNYGPVYGGAFSEMFERVAIDEQAVFVPAFIREVGLEPELMQADGLHPTARGQRRLAENLAPYLENVVDEVASARD
jgi:acyl-CoA thioesterase-1